MILSGEDGDLLLGNPGLRPGLVPLLLTYFSFVAPQARRSTFCSVVHRQSLARLPADKSEARQLRSVSFKRPSSLPPVTARSMVSGSQYRPPGSRSPPAYPS